jgi:hypothetical protein
MFGQGQTRLLTIHVTARDRNRLQALLANLAGSFLIGFAPILGSSSRAP